VVVTPLPPERAIVEFAVDEDIDLIIMATLSQSAVGRFLFGSVAEKVRRRSPIPVLSVAPSQAEEGGA
jgi:nucleotide-binding universal stress UspA family protein